MEEREGGGSDHLPKKSFNFYFENADNKFICCIIYMYLRSKYHSITHNFLHVTLKDRFAFELYDSLELFSFSRYKIFVLVQIIFSKFLIDNLGLSY